MLAVLCHRHVWRLNTATLSLSEAANVPRMSFKGLPRAHRGRPENELVRSPGTPPCPPLTLKHLEAGSLQQRKEVEKQLLLQITKEKAEPHASSFTQTA